MEGFDFCEEFKKSTGKHEGLVHFEKKLGTPPIRSMVFVS